MTNHRSFTMFHAVALVGALGAAVGCTSDVADDSAESAESALNAAMVQDLRLYLGPGQSKDIEYTGASRLVAIRTIFTSATQGVYPVTVEPLDATGDAALWITSQSYANLAISRPPSSRTATLDFDFKAGVDETRIVIRNESMKPARFRVSLGTSLRPVDTDPDEGEATGGGAAPADLVGKHCEGVALAFATHQTLDSRGEVVETRTNVGKPPETFVVAVDVVSATKLRVTTHATSGAPRALHAVATVNDPNAISSSPTQIAWNVPVARDAAGMLVGSTRMGNAKATAAVDASEILLSFAGKISAPWNGNTLTLESSVTAKVLLATCTTR